MTPEHARFFLHGAVFMGCLAVALLFFAFWRRTGDRLFGWFSAAFVGLMVERFLIAGAETDRIEPAFFLLRLFSFLLILIGIIDRNRRRED